MMSTNVAVFASATSASLDRIRPRATTTSKVGKSSSRSFARAVASKRDWRCRVVIPASQPRQLAARRSGEPPASSRTAATSDGDGEAEQGKKEEALIDRDNLDERYYRGFIESEIGEGDNADGRDKLTASIKLAARILGGWGQ